MRFILLMLLSALFFGRNMVSNRASCYGTDHRMVVSHVAGNSSHDCTFKTTRRDGRSDGVEKQNNCNCDHQELV